MKRKLFCWLIMLFGVFAYFVSTPTLQAQVAMTMEINFRNFLVGEPVWLRLTIHNHAAHPLPFTDTGKLKSEVTFEVEASDRTILPVTLNQFLPGNAAFVIPPGESHQIVVPISRYCNLQKIGYYQIRAQLKHPLLSGNFVSNAIGFSVGKGAVVWTRRVGTPSLGGAPIDKIEARVISILSMFDGKEKAYYLNIEDAKKIYAQIRIGYEIDVSRPPQCLFDAASNIHILLYVSPKLLAYFVYDIDGNRQKRKILAPDAYGVVPMLEIDGRGNVTCRGGRDAKKNEFIEDPNNLFRATEENNRP